MSDTTTVTVPTDPAAHARWLAGRMSALATLISRDDRAQLSDLERESLTDAAHALLAALEQ